MNMSFEMCVTQDLLIVIDSVRSVFEIGDGLFAWCGEHKFQLLL